MVLIIRNNRILSSRQSRIKKLLSYVHRDRQKLYHQEAITDKDLEKPIMSLTTVLGTLFLYSVAMFTLPFAAFFAVQHLMNSEFQTDRFTTNCVAVLAAVITVNLIISCYAYQALLEPDDTDEKEVVEQAPSKESLNKKDD